MDRLSNLPYDLIYHIVSLLSTKEVACLQYASKKWMSLVKVIPNLAFESSSEIRGCLSYFVCGLLSRPYTHRIRRFSLKLRYKNFDSSQCKLVNDCLNSVVNRGVLGLELDINVKEDYKLTSEIFTCKSVEKLKLGSGFVIDSYSIPENALLTSLKTLVLDSVRFIDRDGCAFQNLISACPVLEELVIDPLNWENWKWCRVLSSLSLKRFTSRRKEWEYDYVRSNSEILSLDTPSLVYLEYEDVLLDEYPFVNLSSLVEAKLNLPEVNFRANNHLTNLIKGLKNVQILRSDYTDTQLLFYHFPEAVPLFENLSHLSLPTQSEICWEGLKVLLKKSPNLKTLTIGQLHYTTYYEGGDVKSVCECLLGYSFLSTCPIEVLQITEFGGEIGEMVQIKHVLEKLPCLELVELHVLVHARTYDKRQKIMEDLQMLPRASSKCKVQVKFSCFESNS